MINWIINHKDTYPAATRDTFQDAIWNITNDESTSDPIALQIISDAQSHTDYYPYVEYTGHTPVFAVMLWPVHSDGSYRNDQILIIEIDP